MSGRPLSEGEGLVIGDLFVANSWFREVGRVGVGSDFADPERLFLHSLLILRVSL